MSQQQWAFSDSLSSGSVQAEANNAMMTGYHSLNNSFDGGILVSKITYQYDHMKHQHSYEMMKRQ